MISSRIIRKKISSRIIRKRSPQELSENNPSRIIQCRFIWQSHQHIWPNNKCKKPGRWNPCPADDISMFCKHYEAWRIQDYFCRKTGKFVQFRFTWDCKRAIYCHQSKCCSLYRGHFYWTLIVLAFAIIPKMWLI